MKMKAKKVLVATALIALRHRLDRIAELAEEEGFMDRAELADGLAEDITTTLDTENLYGEMEVGNLEDMLLELSDLNDEEAEILNEALGGVEVADEGEKKEDKAEDKNEEKKDEKKEDEKEEKEDKKEARLRIVPTSKREGSSIIARARIKARARARAKARFLAMKRRLEDRKRFANREDETPVRRPSLRPRPSRIAQVERPVPTRRVRVARPEDIKSTRRPILSRHRVISRELEQEEIPNPRIVARRPLRTVPTKKAFKTRPLRVRHR